MDTLNIARLVGVAFFLIVVGEPTYALYNAVNDLPAVAAVASSSGKLW
jgi:hypothetical protein